MIKLKIIKSYITIPCITIYNKYNKYLCNYNRFLLQSLSQLCRHKLQALQYSTPNKQNHLKVLVKKLIKNNIQSQCYTKLFTNDIQSMILLTIFFVFVPYIIMKISLVCEALKKKPKIIVMKI